MNPVAAGAPMGWPRARRVLRVGLLGWARLSFQANQGSGYNLSASELAAGLALMGHRVHYLASGRRYSVRPGMRIERCETWRGVECDDLVNSPNLSPALYNFRNMGSERRSPGQTRVVLEWARSRRIQVLHAHSLEGFGLDLIGAAEAAGIRVVVTPHNYWYCCPQVDLMRGETELCMDYDGGRRCEGCIPGRSPVAAKLKRRLGQGVERIVGLGVSAAGRRAAKEAMDRWREIRGEYPRDLPNDRDPDPEAALGLAIEGIAARADGMVRHNIRDYRPLETRRPVAAVEVDANERFLASDRHLVVLNDYGRRRVEGIEALSRASLVTPPSAFVGDVYVRMGLPAERCRVVRLGQPHFDQIHRAVKRSPYYRVRPWQADRGDRPLRLAYFGAMRPSKGIDVLAQAIGLLPIEIRRRCRFLIRAGGNDWPVRKPLSEYPEVSFNGGYDMLQLTNSWGDYDVGLLPHAWFENSPLVLLEHLHAGKFVVCSRLGGPVEWVRDGVNGLLVPGGQAGALAAAIGRLVQGEVAIPSPAEIHEATPLLCSWPDHVRAVDEVYRKVLDRATAGR